MKNLYNLKKVLLLCSFFYFLNGNAQAPEKMSYQAVIRNTANNLVTNQAVGMKISILQGSASGTAVYSETQTPTSNVNGLVSLEIGNGTAVTGTFATINWANGPYFIKTETDPTGGTAYTITGTSQLLSSPYALYAKTSGSSTPGPQGPAGPQGIQGLTGATGPQGPIGLTGAVGATGPAGSMGPQGIQGVAGTNGTNGTNGADGLSAYQIAVAGGYTGTQAQWLTSLQGTQGPAGPQGIQGLTGATGAVGATGATGATGPAGPIGPQGIQGVPGTNGTNGADGLSAYQIAVAGGYTGTQAQWLASLQGATGPQGPTGATGAAGPIGPQGLTGTTGAVGATGPAGPIGPQGIQGATGPQGIQGVAGTNGTNGANGQGVPTGGATGQVLAKVDGTNYNTAWVTPASGGSSTYPNVELRVTKTAAQTLAATDTTIAQTNTGETVVYSATNDTHAALTGGNTWDGTTFTVGATGAGWYQLTSQLMATNTLNNYASNVISTLIEINNNSASSIYGTGTYLLGYVAFPGYSARSVATGLVYLSAGDVLKIKAKGNAPTASLAIRTDGSTYFSVVRLK